MGAEEHDRVRMTSAAHSRHQTEIAAKTFSESGWGIQDGLTPGQLRPTRGKSQF
jgi:hypothetical protein